MTDSPQHSRLSGKNSRHHTGGQSLLVQYALWPWGSLDHQVHPRPEPCHCGQCPHDLEHRVKGAPRPATDTHFMEACALPMTTRRFCKATSAFCFTTVRLAPWPERRASFSRLKFETCAWGGGSSR